MRNAVQFAIVLASCVASTPAAAWGPKGHEYSGGIADQLLSAKAKVEVQTILGTPLRNAATWADCVKDVSGPPNYRYTSNPRYHAPCIDFETAAGIARMESYVRRNWENCTRSPGEDVCHKGYHYADVAIQHDHYDRAYAGTSDHDLVSAINAAVAVLRGDPAPAPFNIRDKQEALLMLAHFMGDLHQPLHVGAVYLDANDKSIDPDTPGHQHDHSIETRGGNSIDVGSSNLHSDWDGVLASLDPAHIEPQVIARAKALAKTEGPEAMWVETWASDTVKASQNAYSGISYTHPGTKGKWAAQFDDRKKYSGMKRLLQDQQLVKAGVRLTELLNLVWQSRSGARRL